MESDSAYRQGTVLGLTIAEMFILLIFLLLIAFLGFSDQWEKEREKLSDLSDSEQRLHEWYDVIEFHTLDEIKTLTSKAPMFEKQTEELANLRKENKELQEEKEKGQKEREALKKQTEELAKLREKNKELQTEKEELQSKQETLERQTEDAKREAMQAKKELQKGQNPPCWYEVVSNKKGGTREKTHYLFNIAVHDDHMVVQRREYPPGRADDDNGLPYAEEARHLPLDRISYDEPLTDEELDQSMRPIHDLGKNKEVRSYSCVFYAKVWDKTSVGSKERWKRAHYNVLQKWFLTLVVENEPWPVSPLIQSIANIATIGALTWVCTKRG